MKWEYILLRYGEIFLKGHNQSFFENKLIENLRKIAGVPKVKKVRGRLIIDYFSEHHKLRQVFGLVSYSPAIKVEKSMEKIQLKAVQLLEGKKGTFKIEPKRSDKRFPLTSPEINITLGKFIEANTSLTFDGVNPQHLLGVEINQDGAYLFTEIVHCGGGLPTGVEGRVALWVENEASMLAGLLMMKRGCYIYPVGLKERDTSLLQKFSPMPLQFKVVKNLSEVERFIQEKELSALVVGQDFKGYGKFVFSGVVLRPLIAYTSAQVEEQLNEFASGSEI
jgi:adenylyl- and sulfurtransferase ThiI